MSMSEHKDNTKERVNTEGVTGSYNIYDPERAALQSRIDQELYGDSARTGAQQLGTGYGTANNPYFPGATPDQTGYWEGPQTHTIPNAPGYGDPYLRGPRSGPGAGKSDDQNAWWGGGPSSGGSVNPPGSPPPGGGGANPPGGGGANSPGGGGGPSNPAQRYRTAAAETASAGGAPAYATASPETAPASVAPGTSARNFALQDYYSQQLGSTMPGAVDTQGQQYDPYSLGAPGATGDRSFATHSLIPDQALFQSNPAAWAQEQGLAAPSEQQLAQMAQQYQGSSAASFQDLVQKYGTGNMAVWSPEDRATGMQLQGLAPAAAQAPASAASERGAVRERPAPTTVTYPPTSAPGAPPGTVPPTTPPSNPATPYVPPAGPPANPPPAGGSPPASVPRMPVVPGPVRPPTTTLTQPPGGAITPPGENPYRGDPYTWGAGGLQGNTNQSLGAAWRGYTDLYNNPISQSTQNAMTQEALNAANAKTAGAQEQIARQASATGSTAGQYAAMAQLGRDRAGIGEQAARENVIAQDTIANQRRQSALSGFSNLGQQSQQAYNALLGLQSNLSGGPVGTRQNLGTGTYINTTSQGGGGGQSV